MKTDIKILLALICPVLTLCMQPSLAADIDIYGSPTSNSSNPNVLIIIDNSSNWAANNQGWPVGKQGEAELTSLKTITTELSDKINMGLMMHTTGAIDGGYVRYHMRQMNTTNKTAFQELIGNSSCGDDSNSLNGTPNCIYKNFQGVGDEAVSRSNFSGALFEAFKYFGGYTNPANANTNIAGSPLSATQYGSYRYAAGPTSPDPNTDKYAFLNYATDTNLTLYNHTLNSCAKNYIIFIGNGMPNSDSAASLLSGVGGDTSQLALPDYTTSTVTSTTTMGTTTQCYSSAASCNSSGGTSSFATQCASYTEGCACTTAVASSTPVACASGTLSYTVTGHIAASTTDLGLTSSCYSNTSSCSTSDYAAQCAGASCACSTSTTSTTGCTGSKKKFMVVKTVEPSSSNRGYSAQCYSDATSCSSASLSSMCPSCTSFTCAEPTQTTTPSCASGTSQYNVVATNISNVVTPTGTSTVPTGSAINYADEWARFLNRTDISSQTGQQNVKTYTIDVYKDHQDEDATALLRSMAEAGGGKYFVAQNEAGILDALRKIMSEIQSVNSVFASSSLPVSVNTQGTYLNQVFIGMFRPDANGKPRWFGNIKQYQFAVNGTSLLLADAQGNDAISATTGFITPCAESFWSSDSGNYWDFPSTEARGECTAATSQFPSANSSAVYSDLPDGDVVEKGGAAQRLRGAESLSGTLTERTTNYLTRVLKTCDGTCTALSDFNTDNSNITQALLGAISSADRDDLINWVRGKDTEDENAENGEDEMRPSAHGDVVHSQPGVVDYGGSTGVVTFYGSNEGIFHAINGNKSTSDPNRGKEIWGFIAPETFGRLNRLRVETPAINLPGVLATPATPKGYFFDGSVSVYQNSGRVWIFPTMRRGGRAIYAFNATTPTAAGISLKWRRGCFTDDVSAVSPCSTGWESIGQTWSKPQIGTINGYPHPVLVFGGGYDTCEDTNSQIRCTSTPRKGANIWFVNADNGDIIRTYPTNYSVPGDVTIVRNANGYISHVYAGDTGGYLYRINVGAWTGTAADTTWTANTAALDITIADLSETGHARKFMNGPDVVESATFNEVLIGSGDREHPLLSNYPCGTGGVTNTFFMVKDTPSAGYPYPAHTKASLDNVSSTCPTSTSSNFGWYFNLPNACEQVVNKATSIGGYTYFGTNQPVATPSASCSTNLGVARGYAVKISSGCAPTGASRSITFTGGGMPPSPVAGIVDIDGRKQTFCLGCGPDASSRGSGVTGGSFVGGNDIKIFPRGNRTRTYWYKK